MAGLKGDVKLPGVGSVPKWGVVAGAAVAGVGIILYLRNKNSAASPATTAATTAAAGAAAGGTYPPDGTTGNPQDPYSTDPATGETYGDEGYGGGYGYDYGSGSGGSGGSSGGGPPFTDNASWSQYAENYLTGTIGEDAGTVAEALGVYLAGQAVTSAQQSIINQAIGFAGTPPVQGPGGYPPAIKVQSGGGGGSGGQQNVPNVVGQNVSQAETAIKAAGFTYQTLGNGSLVDSQSPAGGTAASSGTLVTMNLGGAQGTVTVPKVTGLSVSAAIAKLRSESLVPGSVSSQTGTVNSQTPGAGKRVPAGSTVDLGVTTKG